MRQRRHQLTASIFLISALLSWPTQAIKTPPFCNPLSAISAERAGEIIGLFYQAWEDRDIDSLIYVLHPQAEINMTHQENQKKPELFKLDVREFANITSNIWAVMEEHQAKFYMNGFEIVTGKAVEGRYPRYNVFVKDWFTRDWPKTKFREQSQSTVNFTLLCENGLLGVERIQGNYVVNTSTFSE